MNDDPQKIPAAWEKWCNTGKRQIRARKKRAVIKCLQDGHVYGYLSGFQLDPKLDWTHPMSPTVEHLSGPTNHGDVVVEARVINCVKGNLLEDEFWSVVEHLFRMGVTNGKILPPFGKCLPLDWRPERGFGTKEEERKIAQEAVTKTKDVKS